MESKTITGTNIVWKGDSVNKYKCHRQKLFDGHENNWAMGEDKVESWNINDSGMPDWLRLYI